MNEEDLKNLAKLREPFPANQVGKLPKPYKADSPKSNCKECGGYHGLPAMHLDFVGHAALTDRFLDVDPMWSWEPLAFTAEGLPAFDKLGGLWIKLTICGVTRLGYGDAGGKTGTNAMKEVIGDALRNAGMRFGAALDLWHKGELRDNQEETGAVQAPAADPTNDLKREIAAAGKRKGLTVQDLKDQFAADNGGLILGDATVPELEKFLAVLTADQPA